MNLKMVTSVKVKLNVMAFFIGPNQEDVRRKRSRSEQELITDAVNVNQPSFWTVLFRHYALTLRKREEMIERLALSRMIAVLARDKMTQWHQAPLQTVATTT